MRKLRGHINIDEVPAEFANFGKPAANTAEDPSTTNDPMKKKYRCTSCFFRSLPRDADEDMAAECDHRSRKAPEEFGVEKPSQLLSKIFVHGAWTRCVACAQKQLLAHRT